MKIGCHRETKDVLQRRSYDGPPWPNPDSVVEPHIHVMSHRAVDRVFQLLSYPHRHGHSVGNSQAVGKNYIMPMSDPDRRLPQRRSSLSPLGDGEPQPPLAAFNS